MDKTDMTQPQKTGDQGTVDNAMEVLSESSKKGWLTRFLPFMGPAFIASVAYIDPGNFATNTLPI